jgi:hypothetical protein
MAIPARTLCAFFQGWFGVDLWFTFIGYAGIGWPHRAPALFAVTVAQVHAYRDWLIGRGDAPKTINRRISSLSGSRS